MTIKSEDKKIKRVWCKKVKQYLEDNWGGIGLVVVGIIILGLIINFAVNYTSATDESEAYGKKLAKQIVRADYPDVLCMATNSGTFRTYKAGTYKMGITKNGWNIWLAPHTSASAFHLVKCEIK